MSLKTRHLKRYNKIQPQKKGISSWNFMSNYEIMNEYECVKRYEKCHG